MRQLNTLERRNAFSAQLKHCRAVLLIFRQDTVFIGVVILELFPQRFVREICFAELDARFIGKNGARQQAYHHTDRQYCG